MHRRAELARRVPGDPHDRAEHRDAGGGADLAGGVGHAGRQPGPIGRGRPHDRGDHRRRDQPGAAAEQRRTRPAASRSPPRHAGRAGERPDERRSRSPATTAVRGPRAAVSRPETGASATSGTPAAARAARRPAANSPRTSCRYSVVTNSRPLKTRFIVSATTFGLRRPGGATGPAAAPDARRAFGRRPARERHHGHRRAMRRCSGARRRGRPR